MAQPIKVLLVDDKEDYCKSLSGPARHKNIQIVYELDWENGFEVLKNDPLIEFVILDGKGKIEADQETEKDNFVNKAMKDIDTYSRKFDKYIPYCVNTGFMDRFESLEGIVQIFEKNDNDREKMFDYIIDKVTNSESFRIKSKYSECFEVFSLGTIDMQYHSLLIDILTSLDKRDFRKKNFSVLRDFFEASLLGLINIGCIPASFVNQYGNPNHEWCAIYFEERNTTDGDGNSHRIPFPIPKSNRAMVRKLKESLSEHQHLGENEILKYEFLSNSHLLMEYLIWIAHLHKTYYP